MKRIPTLLVILTSACRDAATAPEPPAGPEPPTGIPAAVEPLAWNLLEATTHTVLETVEGNATSLSHDQIVGELTLEVEMPAEFRRADRTGDHRSYVWWDWHRTDALQIGDHRTDFSLPYSLCLEHDDDTHRRCWFLQEPGTYEVRAKFWYYPGSETPTHHYVGTHAITVQINAHAEVVAAMPDFGVEMGATHEMDLSLYFPTGEMAGANPYSMTHTNDAWGVAVDAASHTLSITQGGTAGSATEVTVVASLTRGRQVSKTFAARTAHPSGTCDSNRRPRLLYPDYDGAGALLYDAFIPLTNNQIYYYPLLTDLQDGKEIRDYFHDEDGDELQWELSSGGAAMASWVDGVEGGRIRVAPNSNIGFRIGTVTVEARDPCGAMRMHTKNVYWLDRG